MVRKLVIALAAAAAVIAGTTMTASANGGFRAGFVARPFGFHKHRFGFHHFPFVDRFALYGGLGYPYTEDCFAPLWTPWAWRWRYMCY
jgi:hypothetical protein